MKKRFFLGLTCTFGFCLALILSSAGGQTGGKQADQVKKKSITQPIVILDKKTQAPRIIRNSEEYAPGAEGGRLQVDKSNAERLMKAYLQKNESRLGIKTADLKFRKARRTGNFWRVTFAQHHQGVPVFHSRIGLVALRNGKVVSFGSNYDPHIVCDVRPQVQVEAAAAAAVKALKLKKADAVRLTRKQLVVLPSTQKQKTNYNLAWLFCLETLKPNPSFFKVFLVDAHAGNVLRSYDALVAEDLKGQVKGTIWPDDPASQVQETALADLKVSYQNKSQRTGPNGRFRLENVAPGTHDLQVRLEGSYVKVIRNSGTDAEDLVDNEQKLDQSLTAGTEAVLSFPSSDEVNVFYHTNKIHDWYAQTFEYDFEYDYDREGLLQSQIVAAVDCGAGTNGKGGYGATFFGSMWNGQWARSTDAIYHEYTHNVLQEIFDDFIGFPDAYCEGYAMDEGFADYFACALNNDHLQGENCAAGIAPRDLQNNVQYPDVAYNMEGHNGGQIIAGACWDFRSSINKDEADQLVFQALNILAAWPEPYTFSTPETSNFLDALFIAASGSHEPKIQAAFERHNLWPEGPAEPVSPAVVPKVTSCSLPNNQRLMPIPQEIVIEFNTPVSKDSFAQGINLEREDWKGKRAVSIVFVLEPTTGRKLHIKPQAGSEWLNALGTQTNFTLRLKGAAPQGVKGSNGVFLDGNGDGQAGGDYVVKFWVID